MRKWISLERALASELVHIDDKLHLQVLFPVDLEDWVFSLFSNCFLVYGSVGSLGDSVQIIPATGASKLFADSNKLSIVFCGVQLPESHSLFEYALQYFGLLKEQYAHLGKFIFGIYSICD